MEHCLETNDPENVACILLLFVPTYAVQASYEELALP